MQGLWQDYSRSVVSPETTSQLRNVADASQESAARLEHLTELTRQHLAQAKIGNLLSGLNLGVAIANCAILWNINEQLAAASAILLDMHGIQKEQHHIYKRERALKEALYFLGKFQKETRESGDAIARAYSAKMLVQALQSNKFTTADLGDIRDKEFFDERQSEAGQAIQALTREEMKSLDGFEVLYAAAAASRQVSMPSPMPLLGAQEFRRERVPKPPASDEYMKRLVALWNDFQAVKDRPRQPVRYWPVWAMLILLFPISILGLVVAAKRGAFWLDSEGGLTAFGAAYSLFIFLAFSASVVGIVRLIVGEKTAAERCLETLRQKLNLPNWSSAQAMIGAYSSYKMQLKDFLHTLPEQLAQENSNRRNQNDEAASALKARDTYLADADRAISDFLNRHPFMQQFFPKAGAQPEHQVPVEQTIATKDSVSPITIKRYDANTLIAHGSYDRVMAVTQAALTHCGFSPTSVDPEHGVIKATAGISGKSWGEKISVFMHSAPSGGILIRCKSDLKFGFYDWGKNRENVERFFSVLLAMGTEPK